MESGIKPETSKRSEEDENLPLPWEPMIGIGAGYARFRRWSEILGIAAVGFALGTFGPIPQVAKIGVLGALIAIAIVLSWLASKTLAKATQFQNQQLSTMKVRELTEVKIEEKES